MNADDKLADRQGAIRPVIDTLDADAELGTRLYGVTDRRALFRIPGAHVEVRIAAGGADEEGRAWLYGVWLENEATDGGSLSVRVEQPGCAPHEVTTGVGGDFAVRVDTRRPVTLLGTRPGHADVWLELAGAPR